MDMSTVIPDVRTCGDCNSEMPISRTNCPHCGRPSYFPNVDKASSKLETKKLEGRLSSAIDKCKSVGTLDIANKFRDACSNSQAVFACPLLSLHRQVASGTDVFETFYDLEQLRLRTQRPAGFDWAKLRPQAEIELLGDDKNTRHLRYASLSLDGNGLNYGNCLVRLRESMIAHRASCFEGNTAVTYAIVRDFSEYLRSDWSSRHDICLAVFGAELNHASTDADFPSILVQKGATSEDDKFIEVHIFGPITAKSIESVEFLGAASHNSTEKVYSKAIAEKLIASGVKVARS